MTIYKNSNTLYQYNSVSFIGMQCRLIPESCISPLYPSQPVDGQVSNQEQSGKHWFWGNHNIYIYTILIRLQNLAKLLLIWVCLKLGIPQILIINHCIIIIFLIKNPYQFMGVGKISRMSSYSWWSMQSQDFWKDAKSYMGVSIHGGTQKWMVHNGKSY